MVTNNFAKIPTNIYARAKVYLVRGTDTLHKILDYELDFLELPNVARIIVFPFINN